jgi:hypothetical protein
VIERFCACAKAAIAAAQHSAMASRRAVRCMEAPWGKWIFISQARKGMRVERRPKNRQKMKKVMRGLIFKARASPHFVPSSQKRA